MIRNLICKWCCISNRGDIIDQRLILKRLTELQYTRNDIDFSRTTYRVRGDVIDIYPAESDYEAIRVELFGDEIDNLSYFDPLTGELIRRVPRVTIFPKITLCHAHVNAY